MKKLTRTLLALASVALLAQSCNDKGDTNNIIIRPAGVGAPKITYTLQVVDAPGNAAGRIQGVQGASIAYTNAAGRLVTVNTDPTGSVVISDAAPGTFSGRLEASGYASMDFTSDISPASGNLADSGRAYSAVTRLYAIRSNAGIRGHVYGNFAGSTRQPTVADTANDDYTQQVTLRVTYNILKTGATAYPMGSGPGRLVDVNLDPSTVLIATGNNATTGSNSRGYFSRRIHATGSGMVEAYLSMRPFVYVDAGGNQGARPFVLEREANNVKLNLQSGDFLNLGPLRVVAQP